MKWKYPHAETTAAQVEDDLDLVLSAMISVATDEEIRLWFNGRLEVADDRYQDFLSRPEPDF